MTLTFIMHSSCITFFAQFLHQMGVFQDTYVEWMGQIGKITLQIPWKLGNFPVLSIFFQLSLPRIWLTHTNRNYIFETMKDRTIILGSLVILA